MIHKNRLRALDDTEDSDKISCGDMLLIRACSIARNCIYCSAVAGREVYCRMYNISVNTVVVGLHVG